MQQAQLASRFSYRGLRKQVSDRPLTNGELMRVAPSIFAEDKHEDRSKRYTYIPTIQVLDGLRKEGFEPFHVAQCGVRDDSRKGFAKHFLRLRHRTQIEKAQYLDRSTPESNEIIIINSHDGSSAYQMLAGRFRFVCQNGLICGSVVDDIRVRHNGNIVAQVINGAHSILAQFAAVDDSRDGMAALQLTDCQREAFAEAALAVRFPEVQAVADLPVLPAEVLAPVRREDTGKDLWSTFNVVQEKLLDGGLRKHGTKRREYTRQVKGIDGNVTLNRALWILAESLKRNVAA